MISRSFDSLQTYSQSLAEGFKKTVESAYIFAKILSHNDDSGRHGVLIPTEIYNFFPDLEINDHNNNTTKTFSAFDCLKGQENKLAYKYYNRYPERRITRLNTAFNNKKNGARMAVFMKAEHTDGSTGYYVDLVIESSDSYFATLRKMLFGDVNFKDGAFILLEASASIFCQDADLKELLSHFDRIKSLGYIKTLRKGDTGIGYTFEALAGIKENNDKTADFKGIEIKCKRSHIKGTGGKINLFQQAPIWSERMTSLERVKLIGQVGNDGLYSCYSQVTTKKNNLSLWLDRSSPTEIHILKGDKNLGRWLHSKLEERLLQKHSRAVFIKADVRGEGENQSFHYKELVYCERPSINNFTKLVGEHRIVFEFTMSQKGNKVKNHGYPWRLYSEDDLPNLFSLRAKLR